MSYYSVLRYLADNYLQILSLNVMCYLQTCFNVYSVIEEFAISLVCTISKKVFIEHVS